MTKEEMTEEGLKAKYRKFDDQGNRIHDSLSYEQMKGLFPHSPSKSLISLS